MYYYTYEVYINNPNSSLNGCYYYGKHEAKKLDDDYIGSGKLLKRYLNKYGLEGIKRRILNYYNSRDELNKAEQILIEEKRNKLGKKCINMHEGGSGGRWKEYITKKEYKHRCKLISKGLMNKVSPEKRKENAIKASNARKNLPEEIRLKNSITYSNARKNMNKRKKNKLYNKVSNSLKEYYRNASTEELNIRNIKNKETNIRKSKEWRDKFRDMFGCNPERFRSINKMQASLDLFKQLKKYR